MEEKKCDGEDIPIIDFKAWVTKSESVDDVEALEKEKTRVSKEIFDAFCDIGFIIVTNHGMDDDLTSEAFAKSSEFFTLDKETKMNYKYKDPASNRGYISMGQERQEPLDAPLPDIKETFDIGYDEEKEYQNEWPTEALGGDTGFRDTMLTYFNQYDQLHLKILSALARGMGLDDEYFTPLCDGNHQNLRLLHYPECEREAIVKTGQKRGGIHTDYGTITLVSQKDVSGLVAQRVDGSWVGVPPIKGGVVVNVGEMLQRWSNDILRATPHQILDDDPFSPYTATKSPTCPERYSIAFFCNANKETSLECLPVCKGPDRPPRYEPMNAHDYITMRLTSTIPVVQTLDLSTTVAGISLGKSLLNSSNPFATSLANLQELADSGSSGAITTRTACPNFVHDDAVHQWRSWDASSGGASNNTINCLGYSCNTFEYYLQAMKDLKTSKPIFMSLSGYAGEVADMLAEVAKAFPPDDDSGKTVLVEINLSCPNIPGKPPIAYDFDGMKEYLSTVFSKGDYGLKVGVKLTPYFYDQQFVAATEVINSFVGSIDFVTSINTVGCGLVIDVDTEAPVLWDATSGKSNGYGGLGGPAVRSTALGNVRRLRQLLTPDIDVVGCGGVDSGKAAFAHLLCGANAVMVASALLTQGVPVFEKIESELRDIMMEKGYTSIDEFRGKLKDGWSP